MYCSDQILALTNVVLFSVSRLSTRKFSGILRGSEHNTWAAWATLFFFFITPSRFCGILYTCKYSCCPKMGWNWEISDRSFSLCWKYQQHQSNRLFDGNEDQNTMSILPQPFNSNFSNEIIYFSHRFFLFIDFTLWRFGSCTSFASQLSI